MIECFDLLSEVVWSFDGPSALPHSDFAFLAEFRQIFSCSRCGLCLFMPFQRLVCAAQISLELMTKREIDGIKREKK